jgi:Domain of unknown function (DUF4350)
MTGSPAPAAASVSPTARQVWTRSRGILLAAVVLIVAGVIIAVIRSGEQHGLLDPRSADRYGSRAAAELLDTRGVDITVVSTAEEAAAAAGPDSTLLITGPDTLSNRQLSTLRAATANSGGRTIVLAPGPDSVDSLAPRVRAATATETTTLSPDCGAPFAQRAGDADLGGISYATSADSVEACYISGELPTLLRLPDTSGNGDTIVAGTPDFLYNHRLDQHGNASLALQLLGSRPHLVWYLPSLADPAAEDTGDESLIGLIPAGWLWGVLQLAIAAVLTALWRARRLGPLVSERLPVAVRASEATEGRARLYRQAGARGRAAETLRSATRTRLALLLGIPAAHAHMPDALTPAAAAHTGRDSTSVNVLLFGPAPTDDASLVRLADELDILEQRITPTPQDKDRPS